MIRAYAVAAVRAVEEQVMAGQPEGELMGVAASALAEVVSTRCTERGLRRVVALVGPGNNGGDALHAAALLAEAGRVDVAAVTAVDEPHPGGMAAARSAGVRVHRADGSSSEAAAVLRTAELIVDGLLGIGARPGLTGSLAALVQQVPEGAWVLAVDLPSGTDPAGVEPLGDVLAADETVTFGVAKPVHLSPVTEPAVGRLTVVDIGLGGALRGEPVAERLEDDDVAGLWPVPGSADHKYSRGVLGVVAGSDAYPGAAVLCVTAAVESGVGMVRYVGPEEARRQVLSACPEVVRGPGRVQAYVVGPGLADHGDGEDERAQVAAIHDALDSDQPVAVDAGAIEVLAERVAQGRRRGAPTLLTPHAGELARLLSRLEDRDVAREEVSAQPLGSARRAAALTGATVLLKGATTLVVEAAGPVRSQSEAPAWTATAGAGDVLAGLAGTLLAAGLSPRDAGSLAALVHGRAATRANPGGPVRALAVAHALPATVARLLSREPAGR